MGALSTIPALAGEATTALPPRRPSPDGRILDHVLPRCHRRFARASMRNAAHGPGTGVAPDPDRDRRLGSAW